MSLPSFTVGRKVRASELAALVTEFETRRVRSVIKTSDETVTSAGTGATLHNDTQLFHAVAANTNYKIDLTAIMATNTGFGVDIKAAWTMPSGCTFDAVVVAPHLDYAASAAAQEVEFAAWQAETGTTTSTKTWGAVPGNFSYHVRGLLRVGANAGTFQLQWAQNTSSANQLSMKSGSMLTLTPLVP